MKKLITIALALMLVFTLTACGDKKDSGDSKKDASSANGDSKTSSDGNSIGNVSADNWSEVMKENFGIEISLPDGWTIKEVNSPNGVNNVKLLFTPGGSDTYDTFGETLFAACKTASTKADMDKATLAESAMVKGVCTWNYHPDITDNNGQEVTTIIVNYFDNGSDIEMTFTR